MFLEEHERARMAPVRVYDDEGAFSAFMNIRRKKEDYKTIKGV